MRNIKWEYKLVYVHDSDVNAKVKILNEAGEEGWEYTGEKTDTGFGHDYLMKRDISVSSNQ